MATRKIIKIDESKCNGCGLCVPNCREGAIKVVDGKARLAGDILCDGLGACLGHCPQGAISIEEREAVPFDEEAVRKHRAEQQVRKPCGCPGAAVKTSGQWPFQLRLVPFNAAYLNNSDLLVCADCVPLACADFRGRFLNGRTVLVVCPKLDDPESYSEKLSRIIEHNDFKSITYARMEVPCCSGLTAVISQALAKHGKTHIPFKEVIVNIPA